MRHAVFTPGHHPRVIYELKCDSDLLVQMIVDGVTDPQEVIDSLSKGVKLIAETIKFAQAKKAKREKDDGPGTPPSDVGSTGVGGSEGSA